MPQTKCRLGFSCAAMMQQPGLPTEDCLNRQTCGMIVTYTAEEEAELIRFRTEQNRRIQEEIRVTRHQAAVMMLMGRGNPQSPDDFDLPQLWEGILGAMENLRSHIDQEYQNQYIAPSQCEVHRYNVKRPSGWEQYQDENGTTQMRRTKRVFWYNKLTAQQPIFEPSAEEHPVRVIHLSHDDDARNLEARRGIERRNRLTALCTHLHAIQRELQEALNDLQAPFATDVLESPDPDHLDN